MDGRLGSLAGSEEGLQHRKGSPRASIAAAACAQHSAAAALSRTLCSRASVLRLLSRPCARLLAAQLLTARGRSLGSTAACSARTGCGSAPAVMRPRGLQLEAPEELQGVDDAFGDVTISFGALGGLGTSPLSLLSPNSAPLQRRASPPRTAKAAGPATAAASFTPAAAAAPPSPTLPEENDPLGDLPQFGQRGGTAARRKPDARRQSLAIGAMFAGLTQHAEGLLGDSELAVGDEEVQVPLAKSGKLLGGTANHSSLFVDPDTADLLATQLPSPQLSSPGLLGGPGALAGADGQATPTPPPRHLAAAVAAAEAAAAAEAELPAAEQPAECDSPRVAPALRALAASARKTPGGA